MAQEVLSFSHTNSPLYLSFASWVLGVTLGGHDGDPKGGN